MFVTKTGRKSVFLICEFPSFDLVRLYSVLHKFLVVLYNIKFRLKI
jgi:hypothetical protein